MIAFPSDVMWKPCPPLKALPFRITPALLASIMTLLWVMPGRALVKEMVTGLLDGNTSGAKAILSPELAFCTHSRNDPGPLSAVVVTVQMLGLCGWASVANAPGVGGVARSGAGIGVCVDIAGLGVAV